MSSESARRWTRRDVPACICVYGYKHISFTTFWPPLRTGGSRPSAWRAARSSAPRRRLRQTRRHRHRPRPPTARRALQRRHGRKGCRLTVSGSSRIADPLTSVEVEEVPRTTQRMQQPHCPSLGVPTHRLLGAFTRRAIPSAMAHAAHGSLGSAPPAVSLIRFASRMMLRAPDHAISIAVSSEGSWWKRCTPASIIAMELKDLPSA